MHVSRNISPLGGFTHSPLDYRVSLPPFCVGAKTSGKVLAVIGGLSLPAFFLFSKRVCPIGLVAASLIGKPITRSHCLAALSRFGSFVSLFPYGET